jgi:PAS domain S-box-containing protein
VEWNPIAERTFGWSRSEAIGRDFITTLIRPKDREWAKMLLRRFYVSPELGRERLLEIVGREIATRPNCVRSSESTPPPAMLQEAARSAGSRPRSR